MSTIIHANQGKEANRQGSTIREKILPMEGVRFLYPELTHENDGCLEATILPDGAETKVYYTSSQDQIYHTISLATTTDMNTLTKLPNPIIGRGYGGAPANRSAHCSHVVKANSYYYCYATNGYGQGTAGEDRNVYLYRSTDGVTFTDLGKVLDKTQVSGATGFGNISVWPELVNGYYELLAEAFVGGIWQIFRFRSTSLESGWTYTNALPSLQVNGEGMYGGSQHMYLDGEWKIIYHFGLNGNLPTVLGFATSADLVTATIQEAPFKGIETTPYGSSTDQLADPYMATVSGKTYLLAEYVQNTPVVKSELWKWHYKGTLNALLK